MLHPSSQKRGSALLIVLGLLAFLMISAVAFSISMRTEYKAAAAYRKNVLARELLATAFADARAVTDYALKTQRDNAGNFDRDNIETRTVEALAPFKYPAGNRYGRLITSRNTDVYDATGANSAEEEPIAYLLNDKILAHIPPYIASSVYETLERQNPPEDGANHDGNGNRYYIDWTAGWKPILASIPEIRSNTDVAGNTINSTIVGRMAWAVINLSDSLDINAVGSASAYRGLGLTGSELAFGIADPAQVNEFYDLIESADPAQSDVKLPIFCSNADLSHYAATVSSGTSLVAENDHCAPFSWQEAIEMEGDGFYSPFSVYGFWPHPERKSEKGSTTSSSAEGPTLSCTNVDENAISSGSSQTVNELIRQARKVLGDNTAGDNLVRLLNDYIDADTVPDLFDSASQRDVYNNAQPTVENVPMLSEIAFDETDWNNSGTHAEMLKAAIEKAIDKVQKEVKSKTYKSEAEIPVNLKGHDIELSLSDLSQTLALRGYFPGTKSSTGSFTFDPAAGNSFVGVAGTTFVKNEEKKWKTATGTATLSGGTLDMNGGDSSIFKDASLTLTEKEKITLKLKGEDIPVAKKSADSPEAPETIEVTLNLLVDFFVRVPCRSGSDFVDLCPTDRGESQTPDRAKYPSTAKARLSKNSMQKLDANYFRITRPLTATFALQWKIETKENADTGKVTYTAELELADQTEIKVSCDLGAEMKFAENMTLKPAANGDTSTPSLQSLTPATGAWYTIDPRYNWLSPTLGSKDAPAASNYLGGSYSFVPSLSSPHWLFVSGGNVTSGNSPSMLQEDYANAHSNLVPFSWGLKVEDIRYGHNDSGQLFFPAEVAFLPVPLPTNTWHPNSTSYLANSFADYHKNVAQGSFFRTLPVTDLKDGISPGGHSYEDWSKLIYGADTALVKGFGGKNFPEEHRGIVNVFAAQDNYILAQRLRQFAMLGIPSSIKQAAYITYQRLNAAKDISRISKEMLDDDLKALKNLTPDFPLGSPEAKPKYDEFVTKYLFPLPNTSGGNMANARDWNQSQRLYEGKNGIPTRPENLNFIVQDNNDGASFADRLKAYNDTKSNADDKLGQNDMTTLLAIAKECFGDRQQLFLYILRADAIAYQNTRELSTHKALSTACAVALVWRDAYGELPDRIIYYQLIP